MKNEPNNVTATLKVVVTGEFYDDDATEETLRYAVEQDLEDAGFEVDVSLLKEQEAEWLEVDDKHDAFDCSNCGAMAGRKCLYCPGCGAKMKNGTRAMEGR